MINKTLVALAVATTFAVSARLGAQDSTRVSIGLTYGTNGKIGIVILPARWSGADSIYAIVANDLKNSDRFNILPLPEGTPPDTGTKEYATYAAMGAAYALDLSGVPFGVHATLHDVKAKQAQQSQDFDLPAATAGPEWRMAIHGLSDEVQRWVTGQRGIAQTRIVYTRESGAGGGLFIIDSDGWGERRLLAEKMVMSPSWSQDGKTIAYGAVVGDSPYRIYVWDLTRSAPSAINTGGLDGASYSPRFRPGTDSIAWWYAKDGAALYQAAVADRSRVKRGSFTTPLAVVSGLTFSPRGDRVALTWNKMGSKDVYIADVDGLNSTPLCRTELGRGERSDPDWSPDGRRIVYGQLTDAGWQIMVGDVATKNCGAVTDIGTNEKPSWAPDSRHIIFKSTRSGVAQLWVMELETAATRQLTHGGARHAAWSPPLAATAATNVGQAQAIR